MALKNALLESFGSDPGHEQPRSRKATQSPGNGLFRPALGSNERKHIMKFILSNPKIYPVSGNYLIGKISGPGYNGQDLIFTQGLNFFINEKTPKLIPRDKSFPAFIKALIKHQDLTQESFSEEYGFSLATVKSWTSGRRIPAPGMIRLFIKLLILTEGK